VHACRMWRSWSKTEPPPGQRLLGLNQGVPLTRHSSYYGGVLPDKTTIYRGPLVRLYGHHAELLGREGDASSCTRSRITSESATSV
jgi:hypothetical protein